MLQSEAIPKRPDTHWVTIAWVVPAIVTLPLLGVILGGRPIRPYLAFPPITHSVTHEPFSWAVFIQVAVLIVVMLIPFLARVLRTTCPGGRPPMERFPWWGWLAVLWTLIAWWLAWTRFEWMQSLQAHTFAPLWLGYIALVNALTFRRTGHCMLVHRPRYLLSLFPLSAAFWWCFEYLNRYVQNWYYMGGDQLTAWEYLLRATLPFSTVLPAVLGTAECLTASPRGPDGNRFPWGDTLPDSSLAMFAQHHVHEIPILAPASSGDAGKSYYGVHHMAGNVAEWVNDWFGFDYYAYMPERNPPGPTSGRYKSLRGGSWKSNRIMLRTATRSGAPADQRSATVGFRCAKSAPPSTAR